MKIVYAVMHSTRYDEPDEIVKLFEKEEDAKEYLKQLHKSPYVRKSDFYLSDYDVI